jgi:hypothetical protein
MKPKLLQIHTENKLHNKPDIHVMSHFDRITKNWQFVGYKCSKCQQGLKTRYLAMKHVCSKTKINRWRLREEAELSEAKIITVSGTEWKPYEVNR